MKAVGIRIDHARPHASGGAFAAHDQALDAEQCQMREHRRARKGARALLVDDDIGRLRGELVIDGIGIAARRRALTPGRDGAGGPVVGAGVLGAVEHRNAG